MATMSVLNTSMDRAALLKQKNNKETKEDSKKKRNDRIVTLRKQKRDDIIEQNRNIILYDETDCLWASHTADSAYNDLRNAFVIQREISIEDHEALTKLIQLQLESIQAAIEVITNEKMSCIKKEHVTDVSNLNLTPVMGKKFVPTKSSLIDMIINMIESIVDSLKQFSSTTELKDLKIKLITEVVSLFSLLTSLCTLSQSAAIIHTSLIPFLIDVVTSQTPSTSEEMAICQHVFVSLSNILAVQNHIKISLINNGFVETLLKHIDNCVSKASINIFSSLSYIQSVSWTIKCICYSDDLVNQKEVMNQYPIMSHALAQLFQAFGKLLQLNDQEVSTNILSSIGYLAIPSNPEFCQAIIDCGYVSTIIAYLGTANGYVLLFSSNILKNMVKNGGTIAQSVIYNGAIDRFKNLLESADSDVQTAICSALTRLIKANLFDIETLIKMGFVPTFVDCLYLSVKKTQRKICAIIKLFIEKGNSNQIKYLVRSEVISSLWQMLTSDPESTMISLEIYLSIFIAGQRGNFLPEILKKFQGTPECEKVESFCYGENPNISQVATQIMDKFCNKENERDHDFNSDRFSSDLQNYHQGLDQVDFSNNNRSTQDYFDIRF